MKFKNITNFITKIPANYLAEMAKKNVAFVGNCKDLYTYFQKINKNCEYFSITKQNWKSVVKSLTQKDKNNMPKFDVIVGNPPYTRGGKDTRPLYIEILNEIMINSYDSKIVWICPTQWVYGYNIKGHIIKNFKENYKINDYVHITNPFADTVMANLIGIYYFDNNNKNSIDYEDIFYTQFKKPELVKSIEQKFKKFNSHLCDYNNNENSYKYYVNAALIRGHIDQDTGKKKWDWTTLFGEDQRTIFDRKLKDRNVFWKFKTLKECKIFVAVHETDILEFAQFIEKSNSNICLDLTPYLGDYTHEWTETEIAKKLKLTKEEVEYIHQEMKNFGWKAAPRKTKPETKGKMNVSTKTQTNVQKLDVVTKEQIKKLQIKGLNLVTQIKKKNVAMFGRAYGVEWRKINKKFSDNQTLRSYHYAKARIAVAKKFV